MVDRETVRRGCGGTGVGQFAAVGCGLWAVGCGLWAMGYGQAVKGERGWIRINNILLKVGHVRGGRKIATADCLLVAIRVRLDLPAMLFSGCHYAHPGLVRLLVPVLSVILRT